MRNKAIKDLSQLADEDLFSQIEEGLKLIYDHMRSIKLDAELLAKKGRGRGCNILKSVLEEESAKFLVLLDAIRCPRNSPEIFTRHLVRFNSHLAKGVYSRIYELMPCGFSKIKEEAERECREYYLDGPNDVDWIFRNEVLQTREEKLYVDYVEMDGEHFWLSPERYCLSKACCSLFVTPAVYEVASALQNAGFTSSKALRCSAEIWRSVRLHDEFRWADLRDLNIKTIEKLRKRELLSKNAQKSIGIILQKWTYPLYGVNISLQKVDKNELDSIRNQYDIIW
jgi:AbiV family abortive infection protein